MSQHRGDVGHSWKHAKEAPSFTDARLSVGGMLFLSSKKITTFFSRICKNYFLTNHSLVVFVTHILVQCGHTEQRMANQLRKMRGTG
jgi:hypothetical protein